MKKYLSLISVLLALIIVATGAINASAESTVFDDTFDKDTAVSIVSDFVEIRTSIGMFFGWYEIGNTKEAFDRIDSTFAEGTPSDVPDWYTYARVKAGYGPDEVKSIIKRLFVNELAETVLEDSKAFFDRYYEENGSWYYYFYRGWEKLSYIDGDRPCTFFELSELENIKTRLEPDGKTAYVSVPVHRYYDQNDGSPESSRLDTGVVFKLTREDDDWKIADLDFANMIFRAEVDKNRDGKLTEDAVRETLIALVSDIYSMTMGLADCRYDTYSYYLNNRYHLYKTFEGFPGYYSAMEGNLAEPDNWFKYAEAFCSKEVANYLLDFSKSVRVFDNKLYYSCLTSEEYTTGRQECQYSYKLQRALTDKILIDEVSDNKAVATCYINWFPEVVYVNGAPATPDGVSVTLTLEFEKGEDGWKVVNTDFIDELDREIYAGYFNRGNTSLIPERSTNPGTGDAGFFALVIAVAVLLALVFKRRIISVATTLAATLIRHTN